MINMKYLTIVFIPLALLGCVSLAPADKPVKLVQGPNITDIKTPFDEALTCLSGKISQKVTFSVGAIADSTGKEQFTEGGTGKFITQGAGEIVQSALYNAGVTILNRRDPRVLEAEVKWGIRNSSKIIPSKYFITGSINSLDFIPGAGFDAQIDGIGPRYRQNRILVGLDLSVTDSSSGRIVANSSLQKQIFADELGIGVGRFFGDVLVNLDAASLRREATSLALRQMLNLSTYDLLTQLMRPENYTVCSEGIKQYHNVSLSKAWRNNASLTPKSKSENKETKSENKGNVNEADKNLTNDNIQLPITGDVSESQANSGDDLVQSQSNSEKDKQSVIVVNPDQSTTEDVGSKVRAYDIK
jgi:curli biogenesis system outer membrane secretion channel CsgG